MREVVIVSAARTAVGANNGKLASFTATQLGALAVEEAVKRAGISKESVDECIMGCVLPANLGQAPARQAALLAGLDPRVGALTINKVCGSGLKAVMLGAQAIQCGDAEIVVAGGMESMTNSVYYVPKARFGYRMGNGELVDGMINDGLLDAYDKYLMGVTAEFCAEEYNVTRQDQDEYAYNNYLKGLKAQEEGLLNEEIFPVEVKSRKGTEIVDKDEILVPTSLEALTKMKTAFKKDGTVTAGNASKISDGAAAIVLMSKDKADELGITYLAKVGAQASGGLEPKWVLMAPIKSIPNCLKKAGLEIDDIDLYEINDAFSASSVGIVRTLGIDPNKVNVHGSAVSIGHPIGGSGARVLTTLLYAMKNRNAKRGMASLCLGGGESVSLILERD